MELFEDFNIALNLNDVLCGQGADPEIVRTNKPALLKAASSALREGLPLLHPVAIISTTSVIEHHHASILLESDHKLTGGLVSRHLSGAVQVAAVVCTIGGELEKTLEPKLTTDPAFALALDGLGNAAVEKVAQQVCKRVGEQAAARGLTASAPLSPGEPEWPVEVGQPQIFAHLDLPRARITLTSGGMMIPKKSISFVIGIGTEMTQTDPCQRCNLRERCRYRHA